MQFTFLLAPREENRCDSVGSSAVITAVDETMKERKLKCPELAGTTPVQPQLMQSDRSVSTHVHTH